MATVSLKSVSKTYPGKNGRDLTVLNDLDLEVQDHELVVLVGPPSCGLSSVTRMIAGLDDISKGDIFIGDQRVNDTPPKDRDIALVSRDYAPYPRMSVYENLAFGLQLRKFPNAEVKKRVLAAAGIVGLEELLERKPASLSVEQRQRVAIGRAVALQPKAFLFDDALANLDARTRRQMRGEMAKLHQRLQATMIYATHDPIEAMAMGGRIVVMNDGIIQQEGTAQMLYDDPANTLVAVFAGNPPMNLVRGALKQDRDWLLFSEVEDGTIELRLPISEFLAGRDFVGKPVLLGIRPEDIRVAESTKPERYSGNFPALIDLVEVAGAETNLHVQTGAQRLVIRIQLGSNDLESGHRARFELKMDKLRLFDPISGRRIA
jgi:multiple sugar transport system ATP-binding protein